MSELIITFKRVGDKYVFTKEGVNFTLPYPEGFAAMKKAINDAAYDHFMADLAKRKPNGSLLKDLDDSVGYKEGEE